MEGGLPWLRVLTFVRMTAWEWWVRAPYRGRSEVRFSGNHRGEGGGPISAQSVAAY